METTIDFLLNLHDEFEEYENELENELREIERIQAQQKNSDKEIPSLFNNKNNYDMGDVYGNKNNYSQSNQSKSKYNENKSKTYYNEIK